jgi:hypothetical protein
MYVCLQLFFVRGPCGNACGATYGKSGMRRNTEYSPSNTVVLAEGCVMIQHKEIPGVTDTMIKTKIRNSYSSKR